MEIRNSKFQTIPEIKNQSSKVKMTTQNAKLFNFCPVILHFYFCFLHSKGICLGFSAWDFKDLCG